MTYKLQLARDHLSRRTFIYQKATVDQHDPPTELLHQIQGVVDHDDGPAPGLKLVHLGQALLLKVSTAVPCQTF
jgi:hypothetical protein